MEDQDDRARLERVVAEVFERHGVSDAVMLRRVMRARDAVREVDDLLETLERYFTAGAS